LGIDDVHLPVGVPGNSKGQTFAQVPRSSKDRAIGHPANMIRGTERVFPLKKVLNGCPPTGQPFITLVRHG
jgi:hypothetical protein